MVRAGLGALWVGAIAIAAGPARPCIQWLPTGRDGAGEVRVIGLPRTALGRPSLKGTALAQVLRVYVCSDPCEARAVEALPDLWGHLAIEEGHLVFRPRHTVAPGLTLVGRFDGPVFDRLTGAMGTPSLELRHTFPLSNSDPPAITAVYPSGDTIPENTLRMYVTFSAPMSLRGVDQHVHLMTESGDDIPLAFVDVPGGLWDPLRTRLTLLIHPGRVKRGVALRTSMGPVLIEGSTVRLRIDALARGVNGRRLAAEASHTWLVGPPQHDPIDPSTWDISPPESPRGSLIVSFPHALDQALARRAIVVRSDRDEPVGGEVRLEDGETRLVFTPFEPWRADEAYRLSVDSTLEDTAGNRLGRPFEQRAGAPTLPVPAERRFVVRLH